MNIPHSRKIHCLLLLSLLFLFILGMLSFTFYQKNKLMIITSATVLNPSAKTQMNHQEGPQISAKNRITGMSIGITGAPTADQAYEGSETAEKQIGIYSVLPSFSFPEKGSLVEEYDALQKQIRIFYQVVKDCEAINPSEPIENCIQETLSQTTYNTWHSESDCETNEERVFYDITQRISDCAASEQTDCTCTFAFPKNYPVGKHVFQFASEENNILISLQESSLSATLASLHLQKKGEELSSSDSYVLQSTDQGTTGGFSDAASDILYLYKKDASTLSIEDETTFTTAPTTRTSCTLPKKTIYKLCVQSATTVSQYDTNQQKSITEPLVYVFGIDFSS